MITSDVKDSGSSRVAFLLWTDQMAPETLRIVPRGILARFLSQRTALEKADREMVSFVSVV